jgi:hypothetical protein
VKEPMKASENASDFESKSWNLTGESKRSLGTLLKLKKKTWLKNGEEEELTTLVFCVWLATAGEYHGQADHVKK